MTEAETGSPKWLGSALTRNPEVIPGGLAVAVFVLWAIFDGGVPATKSWPGALFLLGLLVATLFGYRRHLPAIPRPAVWAIGLLAGFAAWNFLSITWADDQGAAWDGANRCLLYLTVFGLFALMPWSARTAALLLGAYAVVLAAVAAITLLGAAASAQPFSYLISNRFALPAGYYNANAALFTLAFFPAILLASRREVPWPLRGLLLASAGVLFDFALLPQSRGWLIAAPVALIAYLVLVPDRVRSLIVLAPLAVVAALTASPVLDVFSSAGTGGVEAALDGARNATLIGAAVLFLAGALIGLIEGRVEVSEASARIGSRAIGGLAWLAVLAGVIAAIAVIGNPVSWVGDRWHDFKTGNSEPVAQGSRLGQGLGSNRYDFWRVAADEFKEAPVVGAGSDNFAEAYIRDRRSNEEPTFPHNLPLEVVAGTGIVGGALFGGFLVVTLIGVGRVRLGAEDPMARAVAGVTAVVFIYWFVHSIGDWFWAFPALSAPVFAWLAIGMRLDGDRTPVAKARRAKGWTLAIAAGSVGALLFATASLALPWIATLDVNKAEAIWGSNPGAAFDRLDQARNLNFLSADPDLVEGGIAVRLGENRRVRASFERALERDPRNWYAEIELATLDGVEGDKQSALARLDRVAVLNPREPLTATVRQGVLSGKPVTLDQLSSDFLDRYCQQLGRTAGPNGCRSS
ncbi:MAG TPA: O-antigen ligase family protein [Solirubrobacterales bacterium]|nr:O-antigen ligase family protein [Solirubrobacterales bacterium]